MRKAMKSKKKMHIILQGRSKKSNTDLSGDDVDQGDELELRSGEQILKDFYGSSDRLTKMLQRSARKEVTA